jgi:hypothetical protein
MHDQVFDWGSSLASKQSQSQSQAAMKSPHQPSRAGIESLTKEKWKR